MRRFFSSLTRRPSSRGRPTPAKTYGRKAPPPRAGGHRHCSAATGWRAATHAHLSPTHTRALPETFWTLLRARNQSHKPCKSWIISVFALGLLEVFSLTLTTHAASGCFSIARKAAMTSGCFLAIRKRTVCYESLGWNHKSSMPESGTAFLLANMIFDIINMAPKRSACIPIRPGAPVN